MQIFTFDLTLTGATQNLVDALPLTPTTDRPYRQISFQPDKAAVGDMFIGARGATLSTTSYGIRMDPADTTPPFSLPQGEGTIKLGDFAVSGSAGEILHILCLAS